MDSCEYAIVQSWDFQRGVGAGGLRFAPLRKVGADLVSSCALSASKCRINLEKFTWRKHLAC